ncbi:MAG: hypothetical protein R6V06_07355 [Kiritimatiellia bacterium]
MKGILYLVTGDDDYLVKKSAEEHISEHLTSQDREFGLEVTDGNVSSGADVKACVDKVINSLQTDSMFGGAKATWLRNACFLPGGGRVADYEESKEAVVKLESVLKNGFQNGQLMIITAVKIRKNSSFYKLCAETGKVEDFGHDLKGRERDSAASKQLDSFIERSGVHLGSEARKEFLQRVGNDTRTIESELNKLITYAVSKQEITVADVREIVSIGREAEAWDVLDAFGERNAAKLVESIERLSGQNGVSIMLATMIDRNIRDMLVLREAYDSKWLRDSGMWARNISVEADMLLKSLPGNYRSQPVWRLRKNLKHARNYSLRELRVARFRVIKLREKLVSTGQPEMFLLQTTLLRIMERRTKVASGG